MSARHLGRPILARRCPALGACTPWRLPHPRLRLRVSQPPPTRALPCAAPTGHRGGADQAGGERGGGARLLRHHAAQGGEGCAAAAVVILEPPLPATAACLLQPQLLKSLSLSHAHHAHTHSVSLALALSPYPCLTHACPSLLPHPSR